MIALICDGCERHWTRILTYWDEVRSFPDGIALVYYLQHGGDCSLAVVAVDGSQGMAYATYAKHMRPELPVLWMTDQAGFLRQRDRIPVEGFLVKPLPRGEPEATLTDLLGSPNGIDYREGEAPCQKTLS